MWGTAGMDTSEVKFYDRSYIGEILFDDEFGKTFHNPANQ